MRSLAAYLRHRILQKLETPKQHYERRVYNNPDKLRHAIQPGDVVLVEGRSEMSRIIKLFSSSHWSHVAMYVGERLIAADSPQRNRHLAQYGKDAEHMLVEAFSGVGVIASPLNKYLDYNIRLCRPYGIKTPDLNRVVQCVIARLGQHYDDQNIIAIAWMVLRSILPVKNRPAIRSCLGNCNDYQVICSGMIAQAFQSVGYPIVPALVHRSTETGSDKRNPYGAGLRMRHYTQITPKDFDLSPNFEVIKFNIVGSPTFDYRSLWVEKLPAG